LHLERFFGVRTSLVDEFVLVLHHFFFFCFFFSGFFFFFLFFFFSFFLLREVVGHLACLENMRSSSASNYRVGMYERRVRSGENLYRAS